jgi:mRNA interferase MazF
MSLKKGDIVLVPFPFTDLSTTKLRPAVVLWVDLLGIDITVCFVSSQNVSSISVEEFLIDKNDSEFTQTGFKVTSKVKVSRIVTIERNLITRKLGELGINLLQILNQKLKNTFQLH